MKQYLSLTRQRGYLPFVAVILIVVVGFLVVSIAYMSVGSATATNNFVQSEAALDIAEAGYEETARLLLTPFLAGSNHRIACSAITGNGNLTNTSFGTGTFTATTVSGSPVYANTTLSAAIGSADSTISVTSTSGFASAGRIMIDGEIINYGGISGNSFVGIQRGANYNYNTPHAIGAPVSQYQCMVDSKGGIPNLTSSLFKREIQQAVPLQEAWAVGAASGTAFILTRWNRPTELTWTNSAVTSGSNTDLNGISMLSNADGWAVGNVVGTNFTLFHWNGSSWSLAASPTAAGVCQNLAAVSAVYSNEAWAVGSTEKSNGTCTAGGSRRFTILKWNGTSWTALAPTTIPADAGANSNLSAVHVIDATQSGAGTLGFAVGATGTILKYNGSTWVKDTPPAGFTNNLLGVYVVSASEAWAVGAAGSIIKWNGSTWSTVSSPTATQLNAIAMLDSTLSGTANYGWAVGNSGVAVKYNGTAWSSQNTGSANNMAGVALFFTTNGDVWASGATGTLMHWNGSAWSSITSNVTQNLNAISVIAPQQYPYAWQEIFP